jgi:hypothetical protein
VVKLITFLHYTDKLPEKNIAKQLALPMKKVSTDLIVKVTQSPFLLDINGIF